MMPSDKPQSVPHSKARVPPFFIKNKRCFEGRIMRYVKEHLTEFQSE